ncbi:HupE/UreJ family protein [Nocardioides marmorisolisilvae]|uniref:HupE/UreJ family protein n=1 Tax=Nocardioides marmorisolisilvae TaxID=1542737 RepID=A0A3N0DI58_9ACTN|nr:HupE/UreJ family protein [Nocardioides marmorisolisilvae]RNL75372.1 HupE/UreJ family protein [Nocardioides marmorisolisilvae]
MRRFLFLAAALAAIVGFTAVPAEAHGFTSVVYADVTSPRADHVQVKLGLEYDLLLVSVAQAEHDDRFFQDGQPAWDDGDYPAMVKALEKHTDSVTAYVARRFTVTTAAGKACVPSMEQGVSAELNESQDVPYANVRFDYACPAMGETEHGHVIRSTLFPDSEKYVKQTKTVLTYQVDGHTGSAALDGSHPSFSTEQTWYQRFWEFFRLGANHLLTGIDHILFLIALIAGSRRLREVVLAATSFTLAHSVTFILAALGVVSPPSRIVEPTIALSIAAVAGFHLWRLRREGSHATDLDPGDAVFLGLDRSGWLRLSIVFCFGLVHGLGFAGALGITSSFSWQLLWSLLIFNVGIEAVQIGIIIAAFPALALLRRHHQTLYLWVTGVIAAGVSVMGLIWFVERVSG